MRANGLTRLLLLAAYAPAVFAAEQASEDVLPYARPAKPPHTTVTPKPIVPSYQWCRGGPAPTIWFDGDGKRVIVKHCPDQTAHSSAKTDPPSTLLFTYTNVQIEIFEDLMLMRLKFVPVVRYGNGVKLSMSGVLYMKDGSVRDFVNLKNAVNAPEVGFVPRCGVVGQYQIFQATITNEQFNDVVSGSAVSGDLGWGWKGMSYNNSGHYKKCI